MVAPIREIHKEHTQTRAYEQQYREERGFGVRAKQKAYTINENLLGLTRSGGEIDRWEAPGDDARGWCAPREAWPAQPLRTTLRFMQDHAVALDRPATPRLDILATANNSFAPYDIVRGLYTRDTHIGPTVRSVDTPPGCPEQLAANPGAAP